MVSRVIIKTSQPAPTSQLALSFEPEMHERYGSLRECVAQGVYQRGLTKVAPFPDLTKVIPKKANGEQAQFNPIYVGLLAKAATALGSEPHHVTFRHNGEGAALAIVSGKPEFVAVVMPMRSDADGEETTTRPLWLEEGTVAIA